MINILQERRYPQPTLFNFLDVESKKFKVDRNQLAALSDKTQKNHKKILLWGQFYLDSVRKDIKMMGMPEKLKFLTAKCAELERALEEKGEWPTENAVGWIERYVGMKESHLRGTEDIMISAMRYNWEVFRNLRELDGYISRGDETGYRWAVNVLKAGDVKSAQRTAAFLAGE